LGLKIWDFFIGTKLLGTCMGIGLLNARITKNC
jgi:hypothetical protein